MHTLTTLSFTCIVIVMTASIHLSQCLVDISHWMAANRLQTLALQMNPAMTELLLAGTKQAHVCVSLLAQTLQLGLHIVIPSNHVRFLGVTVSFRRF